VRPDSDALWRPVWDLTTAHPPPSRPHPSPSPSSPPPQLALLDSLLPKLAATGHRVLLFSQMTRALDLVEVRAEGSAGTQEG
jgi:hypothetical protein